MSRSLIIQKESEMADNPKPDKDKDASKPKKELDPWKRNALSWFGLLVLFIVAGIVAASFAFKMFGPSASPPPVAQNTPPVTATLPPSKEEVAKDPDRAAKIAAKRKELEELEKAATSEETWKQRYEALQAQVKNGTAPPATDPQRQTDGYGPRGGTYPEEGLPGGQPGRPRADSVGMGLRVVSGGNGRPFSADHLSPNANAACPSGKVKLEPASRNAGGVRMTREQIMRGDKRWHVVCVD